MPTESFPGLEVDSATPWWMAQRIAFGFLCLVLFAAMLGLFGKGPLSRKTIGAASTIEIQYDRVLRVDSTAKYRVTLTPARGRQDVELALSPAFQREMRVERITPEPEKVENRSGQTIYYFNASPGQADVVVEIEIQPEQPGVFEGKIGRSQVSEIAVKQLVLP